MKTNKTNLKSRIFAVMVSVMLLATCFMSTTAFANTDDDAIATFHKVLTVEDGVKVPPATFNFTITNGDANYTDGNTIDAGFKANDVVVNPVSFGPTDTLELMFCEVWGKLLDLIKSVFSLITLK